MSSSSIGQDNKRRKITSSRSERSVSGHHYLKIYKYLRTVACVLSGQCITSAPFTVGGHSWCIEYYPNGTGKECRDYISFNLVLNEDAAAGDVRAFFAFRLADASEESEQDNYLDESEQDSLHTMLVQWDPKTSWEAFQKFIMKDDLAESGYLKDNSFTIRCDIVIYTDNTAEDNTGMPDLCKDLYQLFKSQVAGDVVFEVRGESINAHRAILAARSRVFNAEFFGEFKEAAHGVIVCVEDMEADAFKALLRYAYSGSLPPTTSKEDEAVMCTHLLVAADRYGMERLKVMCAGKLYNYIDVDTVAIILTLAEQHYCRELKAACLRFLSSRANMRAVSRTDSFQHLSISCPSLMIELLGMCI